MKKLMLALWLIAVPALAERHSADHNCNLVLRMVRWTTGATAGWMLNADVKATLPVQQVGVQWRLQGGTWHFFPLHLSHRPTNAGYRNYEGFLPQPAGGHPSMYFDTVAVAHLGGDRLYDHNFESGDTGFVRADRTNNWVVFPSRGRCAHPPRD